jgi:DNA-binding transcriptional LysR family regulator
MVLAASSGLCLRRRKKIRDSFSLKQELLVPKPQISLTIFFGVLSMVRAGTGVSLLCTQV